MTEYSVYVGLAFHKDSMSSVRTPICLEPADCTSEFPSRFLVKLFVYVPEWFALG